ncbi:DUF2339 domain-containing protein [Thioclava sp. FR2]|uniref:DUF2339 domain-containing protein n=1 Tax=Thioclava sp. FR2 TaxID=3445780 RepID=UPI003EBAECF8
MFDLLLLLIGLGVLAIPVLLVILFLKLGGMRRRIEALEARIARGAEAPLPAPRRAEAAPVAAQISEAEAGPLVQGKPVAPEVEAEPVEAEEEAPAGAGSVASPWDLPTAPPTAPPIPVPPTQAGIFGRWMLRNWVYVVSAASLALAGVFLVQYGIEKGYLPPGLRVLSGIAFGLALIAAGEALRRKQAKGEAEAAVYLPAVFSGAGVVSVFAAIVAARQMYGLIGPELALVGQVIASGMAIILGWRNGPLLVAVGLIGAAASPFIVSGQGPPGLWLYGYFALVATVGLAVDAWRRWAWVSVLALALGYACGWLLLPVGGEWGGWVALMVVLPMLAAAWPERAFWPRQEGPCLALCLWDRRNQTKLPKLSFPVKLVAASLVASSLLLLRQSLQVEAVEALLGLGALALLALIFLIWAARSEGLVDLPILPAAAFVAAVTLMGLEHGALYREFLLALQVPADATEQTFTGMPMAASVIFAFGVAVSLGFAWRAVGPGLFGIGLGLGAVLAAPMTVAALELLWEPGRVIGTYPWALHVMGLAAGMVGLALRFAARDGEDKRRVAHATLAALSLIALALFLILSAVALTLALAVLLVVAAALDRRFRLPEMGLFIQAAVAVLSWRLLIDPGLEWAVGEGPISQVILAFSGPIAAAVAALVLLRVLERPMTKAVLESAASALAAVFGDVMIFRLILDKLPEGMPTDSHYGLALLALPWLVLMLAQLYRAGTVPKLRGLRYVLAFVSGMIFSGVTLLSATVFNPLFSGYSARYQVHGPLVLDTLALAYGLPGLILILSGWKLPGLAGGRRMRIWLGACGAGLALLYVGLDIRRFWQGDILGVPGVRQGELYTYTLALLILGAGMLYQAIATRSAALRRLAMFVIALTVAKVFLIDISGLTGLTRVLSFLCLGLSLAGLAWLNRWAGAAGTGAGKEATTG